MTKPMDHFHPSKATTSQQKRGGARAAMNANRLVAAMLCIMALAVGTNNCAQLATRTLAVENAHCGSDAECEPALRCKAGQCTPTRSRAGQVCVTNAGCATGLTCVRGHCASGRASRQDCERACAHVAVLVKEMLSTEAVPDPTAEESASLISLVAETRLRCQEQCLSSGTTESVRCLEDASSMDGLSRCP